MTAGTITNYHRTMDVSALRSFVAVCRSGSFRVAARERHVSQPGVSRHVQRLETELGVALLVRHRKHVVPTAAGSRLFAYAMDTIAAHDRIIESLARDDAAVEGELRIAASTAPGEYLLPGLLFQFTEIYPRVRPHVAVTDSASAIAQVAGSHADLGFTGMRVAHPSLEWTVVAEDELVLAVPGRHPFAGRASVDVSELKGLPFIEREPGSGTWTGLRRALDSAGIKEPGYTLVMVVNSTHATLAAVNNGFGFSIVSSLAVHEHEFDQVYPARLTGLDTTRSLYMVKRPQLDSSVAHAFGDWVLARLAKGRETIEQEGTR
ncbi:MAG: LysR family transcriptional regulator [Chloroflexi bacterium]|nr:LysR family transcriptional regulator [Chloroflexota bacterium]